MSRIHSVIGTFKAKYSLHTITKIFEYGEQTGFWYNNSETMDIYNSSRHNRLQPAQAARLLSRQQNPLFSIAAIYPLTAGTLHTLHISVRKIKPNTIEIEWYGLDAGPKTFASGKKGVNYPFYIKKFLETYHDLEIISFEATYHF